MAVNPLFVDNPLQVISTAITPVVMISATAILIGGVSSKHASLSDRFRALTAEYRRPETTPERRRNIQAQLVFFRRRLHYTSIAHVSLMFATACFIAMVIVISFTVRITTLIAATLPFFMAGVTLLLIAVVFEVRELQLSGKTVDLETSSLDPE